MNSQKLHVMCPLGTASLLSLQVVGGNPGVLLSVAFALRFGKTLEEGKI
jgi:hypothetical protein